MIVLAPRAPTSHYALAKIHSTLGELRDSLAKLEDCLAVSEALGAQYHAALYPTTISFCAVQVRDTFWGMYCGGT